MTKRQTDESDYNSEFANKRLKSGKKESKTFQIHPRGKFDKTFPHFREPQEIGYLSQDIKGSYHKDRSKLRFYIKPNNPKEVDFDLNIGYRDFIRKDESKKEYIDSILKWLQERSESGDAAKQNRNLHTDFVCWRGLLTKLLCTPYENRDDWMIVVTLYNGTYYLCEFDTEQKKRHRKEMTEKQDQMTYWGWKFEQYLTSDKKDGRPITDEPINNIEGYCTIVRSRLDSHSIREVDAIDPILSGNNKYLEFKTTREIDNQRQDINFKRFKLIKWWAQSFLVGIPKIISGFRDDDGIVHRLGEFGINEIPHLIRDIRDPWKPNICFNFLNQFLTFLKENVKVDNPSVVHLLEWEPSSDIRCTQLPPDSEYKFLPDWYINRTPTDNPP